MTRTHWLAAWAAVLLLGAVAQAQQCRSRTPEPTSCGQSAIVTPPCASPVDGYSAGPGQTTEAPRVPYHWELPQILYPPQALCPSSNPALWAQLFEAIARSRCDDSEDCDQGLGDVQADPRERARHRSREWRMASELLKLYRLFYHHGHYKAAEIVAERALRLDPTNEAAEQAAAMAHQMVRDSTDSACHEGCSSRSRCGVCSTATVKKNEKCGCAKASCGCAEGCACVKKSCTCAKAAKPSCACGEDCACCKECACGADCPCARVGRQNVLRIRRLIRPVMVHPIPPPVMLAPPPPPAFPVPMPQMMAPPMPMPGMMQVCPPPMPGQPWGAPMPPWACPPAAVHVERLPPPCLVSPPATEEVATEMQPAAVRMRIMAGGHQVHMVCPHLEACCDTMTPLGDGRILLEGDVFVHFHVPGQPAKIKAARMIVNPADGSYEVNPLHMSPRILKHILHEECVPSSDE